jgi:hypothetical protein
MGIAAFLGILFLLASSSVAEETNAGTGKPLYHFSFDEKTPANTGSIGGEAVEDSELRNLQFALAKFVPNTPSGTGYALDMAADWKHPHWSSVLVLPESEQRLGLSKPGQAMTVSMWVKLHPEDSARDGRTLIAKGQWAKEGWWLGLNKANQLVFQYRPASHPKIVNQFYSQGSLPVDAWVHVAVIVRTEAPRPKGIEMYLDGERAALNRGAGGALVAPGDGPVVVGAMNTGNGGPMNAVVDDVRLYEGEIPISDLMAAVPGIAMEALSVNDYITHEGESLPVFRVQDWIDANLDSGRRKVTLPDGRFRIPATGIRLRGVKDLTLEGAGPERTVLVSGMWDGLAVGVERSQDVTFRNFAVDRDPVQFVQATLTSVRPDGTMEFEVHKGYPKLTDKVWDHIHGTVHFYDQKTRRLVERHHWFGPQKGRNVIRVDETHGRLKLSPVWAERVDEGDFVILKTGLGSAFVFRSCDSVRMEDVAILASGSIGVGARFLTGENYFRYTIKRGPTPAGASQPRLVGTGADGMQYFWSPGAVTFESCDLGFTGDDCINISLPQVLQVLEVQSPTRFLTTTRTDKWALQGMADMSEPGDTIRALRYGTFEPLGDLPLKSFTYEGHREGVQWLADERGHSSGRQQMGYVMVELQEAPSREIKVGDRLVPRKFLPEKFVIRNSHFHDTFARGLLIMASNGVIENNTIEYTGLRAIDLRHEIPGFGGAGWVSNVAVRNNTIRHVCFDDDITRWPGSDTIGAISLSNTPLYRREPLGSYPWATGHRNVQILNNTIEDSGVGGIFVNGLDGGEICGNVLKHTNHRGGKEVGNPMGLSAAYAITIMNSKDVKVSDNEVSDWGKAEGPVGDLGVYPIPPGQ